MPPTVWIAADVSDWCEAEAERVYPDETGGVLMGWQRPDNEEIVVVHATGPGVDGVHQPRAFRPDNTHHLAAVADIYQRSGRKVTYLGDWHTHPDGTTSLSRTDQRTLGQIAEHAPSRCPTPLMVVCAGGPDAGWKVKAHLGGPRGRLLWRRPASQSLTIRTWHPEPGELDMIGYPFR